MSGDNSQKNLMAKIGFLEAELDSLSAKLRSMSMVAGGEQEQRYGWNVPIYKKSGLDLSKFAFGYSLAGNVVKVSQGNVRHGTRNVVAVAGGNITINADHTWIYVSYTYGGGAALENSTTAPTSVENILRVPLHKWRLESGVVRLEQILHVGDIIIPGAFA